MNSLLKTKKIFLDIILNLIGSFFVTGVSQLIVYPFLANRLGENSFGSMLTLIGLSNVIGVVLGNSLNNVKILNNNKYIDNNINGDFKYLLNKSIITSILSMVIVVILFNNQINKVNSIILILLTVLIIYRGYLNAYYRINLRYNLILVQMIVTGLGYLIGLFLFKILGLWTVVFLSGEMACYIFSYYTTEYKYEKNHKTKLFYETKNQFIQLVSSNLVVNLLLYADRLLINPFLGASNVTIYYVSSIVGKVFGIVLQPISSVILTYLSKIREINKKNLFFIMTISIFISGIIGYFIIIKITPLIIYIFYRNVLKQALIYSNIANLSVIFMIMGSLIQPYTLKFSDIKWQTIIQSLYGITYIVSSLILMSLYGLMGFCIASMLSNFLRLILFLIIGYLYIEER
ncbi:hypothetical protein QTI93_11845 [Clostridium perfringens]|nr:hypothetical protein [Clostridium perfringens]MDM0975849.1 hypothetical protein [Clostridium perfringens]